MLYHITPLYYVVCLGHILLRVYVRYDLLSIISAENEPPLPGVSVCSTPTQILKIPKPGNTRWWSHYGCYARIHQLKKSILSYQIENYEDDIALNQFDLQ